MATRTDVISSNLAVQGEECKRPNGDCARCRPVSSIVLIAEYTTNLGPLFDDYFLTWEGAASSARRSLFTLLARDRAP